MLKGHTEEISAVCFYDSGGRIVSGSNDKHVRVWDARTYVCVATLSHAQRVVSVACDGIGRFIAVLGLNHKHCDESDRVGEAMGFNSTIYIWDASTLQKVNTIK